jgi:hypothetical protein
MAKTASTRLSADDWHSPTKANQSARPAVSVAGGSCSAPIVTGSKKATRAADHGRRKGDQQPGDGEGSAEEPEEDKGELDP